MRTDNMIELNPEEMEAVSGGFWEEIGDFGWRLWDKVKAERTSADSAAFPGDPVSPQ